MASIDFSGLVSNLGSLMPSSNEILQSLAVSAASGVLVAGLKAQTGSGALDPLGLFPHNAAPVAPTNNANGIFGPTITASAFSSLTPAAQAAFLGAQGHIISG